MRERPIIFSGDSVRAILAGEKTQTRRIIKPQPVEMPDRAEPGIGTIAASLMWDKSGKGEPGHGRNILDHPGWACPYGEPGDQLWVREGIEPSPEYLGIGRGIKYTATLTPLPYDPGLPREVHGYCGRALWPWPRQKKRQAIHMPRWASRITLEVLGVRVERLQQISERDAEAEGFRAVDTIAAAGQSSARRQFECAWDYLNGKRAPWASNPWVWIIGFRRIKP